MRSDVVEANDGGGRLGKRESLDGYETDLEMIARMATGLAEDTWSSRIPTVALCLFGFVIVLIEEEEGRREDLTCTGASGTNV